MSNVRVWPLEPVAPAATANAYSRPRPVGRQRPFLGIEARYTTPLAARPLERQLDYRRACLALVATMTAAAVVRVAVVRITIGKGSDRVRKTKIGVAAKVITGDLAAHRVIATMLAISFMELIEGVSS
jgi:hypothetical protein